MGKIDKLYNRICKEQYPDMESEKLVKYIPFETEHKGTLEWLKDYYTKYSDFPSLTDFAAHIVYDHSQEFDVDKYYEALKNMEDNLKLEKKNIESLDPSTNKTRIYVKNVNDAPKGVDLKQGDRGGYYYVPEDIEDKKQNKGNNEPDNDIRHIISFDKDKAKSIINKNRKLYNNKQDIVSASVDEFIKNNDKLNKTSSKLSPEDKKSVYDSIKKYFSNEIDSNDGNNNSDDGAFRKYS